MAASRLAKGHCEAAMPSTPDSHRSTIEVLMSHRSVRSYKPEPLEPGDRIYIQKFVIIYQPDDVASIDLGDQHTIYES